MCILSLPGSCCGIRQTQEKEATLEGSVVDTGNAEQGSTFYYLSIFLK